MTKQEPVTKEEFALMLTGREYGEEMTKIDETSAKNSGLVVIFGYSDDNVELRGSINDEVGCYNGAVFRLHRNGVLQSHDSRDCECEYCGYDDLAKRCAEIEALWCKEGDYSWTYKTELPHATFEIVEDGGPFCRGIVIEAKDLPEVL